MKKTFTIFILFIACTSMLHGMDKNYDLKKIRDNKKKLENISDQYISPTDKDCIKNRKEKESKKCKLENEGKKELNKLLEKLDADNGSYKHEWFQQLDVEKGFAIVLKSEKFNDEGICSFLRYFLKNSLSMVKFIEKFGYFSMPLCEMAKRRYIKSIKFLLENFKNVDVNQTNKFCDKTALRIAALNNDIEIAQLLLKHGSSTSSCLDDRITISKNQSMLRLLLTYGAISESKPIYFDSKTIDLTAPNNKEVLKKVFTDVPQSIDIIKVLKDGIHIIIDRKDIFDCLIVDEKNAEKMDCFLKNHLEIIDTFNKEIAEGVYPLDYAIYLENPEMVKLLLIHGIDTTFMCSEDKLLRFRFTTGIHEEIIEKLRSGKLKITLKKVIQNGESGTSVEALPV